MDSFVLPKPETPSVAVIGTDKRFAVRRIFCVGRNYAEHAKEMGNDPVRDPPFFFSKPADSVVDHGAVLPYPRQTANLHHEAELVVAIGLGGAEISANQALTHVWGYGVGNDLTRRDLQATAKEMRRPWDLAKGFDNSAVCGPLHPVSSVGHIKQGRITARVNGDLRQSGDIGEMIWPVADVISFLSHSVDLAAGDLIFTGTPAGVGEIRRGEKCTVAIAGLGEITTSFV